MDDASTIKCDICERPAAGMCDNCRKQHCTHHLHVHSASIREFICQTCLKMIELPVIRNNYLTLDATNELKDLVQNYVERKWETLPVDISEEKQWILEAAVKMFYGDDIFDRMRKRSSMEW